MAAGIPIVNAGSIITCAHGGLATAIAPCYRVRVDGQSVVTIASPFGISGCVVAAQSGQSPCLTGEFTDGASRVTAGGVPLVLESSMSACEPSGSPMMVATVQSRVKAV